MYERFTDRARKVMQWANEEACRFGHEFVGPEHILLAMLKNEDCGAMYWLKELRVELQKMRKEIEDSLASHDALTVGKLPLSILAQEIVAYSFEQARKTQKRIDGPICTEHVLLAILSLDRETIPGTVLENHGVTYKKVWELAQRLDSVEGKVKPVAEEFKVLTPELAHKAALLLDQILAENKADSKDAAGVFKMLSTPCTERRLLQNFLAIAQNTAMLNSA